MAELIVDCSHSCAPTSDVVHASVFSLAAVENISAWKKKTKHLFKSIFLGRFKTRLQLLQLLRRTLLCCETPEKFCGLWNFTWLSPQHAGEERITEFTFLGELSL